MNHQAILKRAWHILFNYKALWVFGFILALTTASMTGNGGGGGSSGRSSGNNLNFNYGEASRIVPQLGDLNKQFNDAWNTISADFARSTGASLGWVIAVVVLVALLLIAALVIAHYVSKVAMIKMVNGYEESGEKLTWKQGLRLGWSRPAWRLFLIDLLIGAGIFLGIVLSIGCVALPFMATGAFSDSRPHVGAIIAGVGLTFLLIFAFILLAVILGLVLEPIHRACVLNNLGVFESIGKGWRLVRANLKDVFLMGLILFGIQIAFFIVVIPVALVMLGLGLAIGGGSGLAVYLLSALTMSKEAALIPAAIVGALLFLLIMIIPLTFVEGLKETYLSSAWTLLYRELRLPHPQPAESESNLPGAAAG